jgi:hypothetical protein
MSSISASPRHRNFDPRRVRHLYCNAAYSKSHCNIQCCDAQNFGGFRVTDAHLKITFTNNARHGLATRVEVDCEEKGGSNP